MEEQQLCSACGANLAGPFEPSAALTRASSNEEPEQEVLELVARSWVCVSCGLVHWYAEGEALQQVQGAAAAKEPTPPKPATSYERRAQVLRMLRRVRRM